MTILYDQGKTRFGRKPPGSERPGGKPVLGKKKIWKWLGVWVWTADV